METLRRFCFFCGFDDKNRRKRLQQRDPHAIMRVESSVLWRRMSQRFFRDFTEEVWRDCEK
ncbi:MAG TPA: hypothetical protein DEB39_15125 [Planctomycetaceae bacterium]|nr:hypothetical protein [Planctomycetaceae bacterium]